MILQHIKQFKEHFAAEEGATVVEYGILVALVIAVCIAIIIILGGQIQRGFENFSQSLTAVGVIPPVPNP